MKKKSGQDLVQDQVSTASHDAVEAIGDKIKNFPSRVLLLKNFILTLSMPGRNCGAVTTTFRAGEIIKDAESIKLLVEYGAKIEIL